jgi:CDP-glucose 4,6-dehydratase
LINFTTDKVYENLELERGYTEEDRLGGYDPYSSSKASSELISSAYRNSFFNPNNSNNLKYISTVRCGNVIGGGDWQKDRLIPDCMRALLSNEEMIIRNPESVRPWQLVLEPIRALLMLTRKMYDVDPKYSGSWNFGANKEYFFKVKDIVDKIINYIGRGSYKIPSKPESQEYHETKLLLLDINKAEKDLGWKPEINIDETIEFLCNWYMEENVNYDFDVKQIKEYFQRIKQLN